MHEVDVLEHEQVSKGPIERHEYDSILVIATHHSDSLKSLNVNKDSRREVVSYLVAHVVETHDGNLSDLSSHSGKFISDFYLVVLVLFLLKKLVDHFFTGSFITAQFNLIKSNLLSDNLFDIIVEPLFADDIVFVLD